MSQIEDFYNEAEKKIKYHPDTGVFIWRYRKDDPRWSYRYAGTECGSLNKSGRVLIGITVDGEKRLLYAHRLAWYITHGVLPKGVIDHIDGNPTHNWIDNLRDVDQVTNCRNARMPKNNTSGITGVCWHKKAKKWVAQAAGNGKYNHLGCFDSIEEAAKVVADFRRAQGYTDHHGNIND